VHLQCKYNRNIDSVIAAFLFSPVVKEDEMMSAWHGYRKREIHIGFGGETCSRDHMEEIGSVDTI
jgi:hypothetical protein